MDCPVIEILDDFVDLDAEEKTAEDFISEWDIKCRKKLSLCSVADNENELGDLMRDYFESLKEMVVDYGDNDFLKTRVFCHMSFFYQYCMEMKCYTPDSYLCYMEDILSLYCNVQLQLIRSIKKNKDTSKKNYKKKIMAVCRHLIKTLTVFLLDRSDHILHVLIKMNTKNLSESSSDLLNVLYKHFLTNVPALNRCDESFCRSYIVFQKWKEIKKSDEWEHMDRIMYQLLRRTPDSVKNNETIKKILMPVYLSTVDVVLNLIKPFQEISNAYFKHINSKKSSDLGDFDFNLDLVGDDDDVDDTITAIEGESDEDVQFMQLYYEFEKNMSSLPHSAIDSLNSEIEIVTLKEELDDELYSTIQDSNSLEAVDSIQNVESHMNTTKNQYEDSLLQLPSDLGVSQIRIGSITTVDETPNAVRSVLHDQLTSSGVLDSHTNILSNSEIQLEVAQPNNILCSDDLNCNESNLPMTQVAIKNVEVQAVEYGITTPPFDGMSLEHTAGPVLPCLYTNIGQDQKEYVNRRSVEVQVDPPTVFNDYGLTPPNDLNIEEHGTDIEKKCLYTDIRKNQKNDEDLLPSSETECEDSARDIDSCDNLLDSNSDTETTQITFDNTGEVEHSSSFEKEVINLHGISTKSETNRSIILKEKTVANSIQLQKEPYSNTESSNHIDTGQKLTINKAPNIETRINKLAVSTEICNGDKVLKPLQETKTDNDLLLPYKGKIIFTSTSRLTAPLETFSKFEMGTFNKLKENQDLDDILSGPLTNLIPEKNNPVNSREKFDLLGPEISHKNIGCGNSRSNSPIEMTSPPYETIDDFKNHYSDCVNGKVPPGRNSRVPQGILKKSGSSRRKNDRIMFDEVVRYKSAEKTRVPRIRVPKSVNRDKKLKQTLSVEVNRLAFVENELKNELKKRQTIQVIYDKTTNHINDNDVVRCVSPPKLTWNLSRFMPNKGKVDNSIENYHKSKSYKCEMNQSTCCIQLSEQFTKLNCNVLEDNALNLTISPSFSPESEFSNSPHFYQHTDEVIQRVLEETSSVEPSPLNVKSTVNFLSDNSNFYKSKSSQNNSFNKVTNNSDLKSNLIDNSNNSKVSNSNLDIQLPTAVPETYDFDKNLKNEVFSKIDSQTLEKEDSDCETRLPLKKRKVSVAQKDAELKKEEISYPATPMISIAEVEALHPRKINNNSTRPFKTPAERKEMPPLPVYYNSDPSPIITDQFNINNHTYNNPTINYHMNNVPLPFINIPCGSYYSLPPILVPFNNVSNFEPNKSIVLQQDGNNLKKENRKQGRQMRKRQI